MKSDILNFILDSDIFQTLYKKPMYIEDSYPHRGVFLLNNLDNTIKYKPKRYKHKSKIFKTILIDIQIRFTYDEI